MIVCILVFLFNFILYFLFGSLITAGYKSDEGLSLPLTLVVGFFLYYSIFSLVCVPVMYRWRPLSMLVNIWVVAVVLISIISIAVNFKKWRKIDFSFDNKAILFACILLTIIETVIILYSYQFTLDAAYYVANVGTSVDTNMMNVYDPYTGDWQDHFQMRYFFATYPQQDAVMCYLFKIHPLIQTKLIMSAVTIFMTNIVYIMIGRKLFGKKDSSVFLFLLFSTVAHFFFITIYTSSNFMITRTYEGKNILANIVLPAIVYFYICLLEKEENLLWVMLFTVCFGATVVSNSSNMLVPAALSVFMIPLAIKRKSIKTFIKTAICMLPCIILLFVYVAYVKGLFVFYTYPR